MCSRPLLKLRNALVVAGVACLMAGADVRGASKIQIAAIGDNAPGGGQFLGPALTGAPSAAGDGWVAFRTLVTEGSTSEQIVVAKLTGQRQRAVVAALGQSAGKRGGLGLGTFKQFLGRPTVNANGDVAFVALLTNSDAIPSGLEHVGEAQPAGVFLFRQDAADGPQFRPIALARDVVPGAGALDLTPIDDSLTTSSLDLLKRTPGLDDAGNVAFVAGTYDPDPTASGSGVDGAIFIAHLGDAPTAVVRLGDPVTDGVFDTLGAPALNTSGVVAFVATVDHGSDFFDDGVYLRDGSGTISRIARDGDTFIPPADPNNSQQIAGFGDLVDINDAGDVAFAAGGMLDLSTFSSSDISFGVLVAHAGQVKMVTYPGLLVPSYGRIRGGELGPDGGSEVALPSLAPDGTVAVFGQLTGGNGEAVFRASPPDYGLSLPVAKFGGSAPDASPLGGVLFAAESSPTADALGNLAFFARLGGASVTEALIFRPAAGGNTTIAVGEATPTKGRFGGPPFSSPAINDADDVVFKSSMATGPSALGIFRWRGSDTTALVRTGDAAPIEGSPAILDLPGDPSLNANGDVAFAALLAGIGRGVFVADANGIRPIVLPNDPVPPAPAGAQFENIAAGPLLLADGTVVFRGSFAYADPVDPLGIFHEEAIFRMDTSGTLSILARTTQTSPTGARYFRFQDAATSGSLVAFRAPLGDADSGDASLLPFGIFLVDPNAAVQMIAVQNQDPGIGKPLSGLTSRPTLDGAGNVAFLGKVGEDEHAVLVRHATDGSSTALAEVGGVGLGNGTYRSLGRPTMNSIGHLAFRATFEKTGGGIPGFLLTASSPPRSFVAVGESDEGGTGGHLSSLNANAALNAKDHLVFVASVNSGRARNGIFLASPTLADAKGVRLRMRDKPANKLNQLPTTLGTLRGRITLAPGDVGKPANGAAQAVTITASDALGPLFSLSIDKGGKAGRAHRAKGANASFRRLSVQSGRRRGIRLSFATAPWKAPFRESNRITPPLTLRIDVGAHSGSVILPCSVTDGGALCPAS